MWETTRTTVTYGYPDSQKSTSDDQASEVQEPAVKPNPRGDTEQPDDSVSMDAYTELEDDYKELEISHSAVTEELRQMRSDFINLRNRSSKAVEDANNTATEKVLAALLPSFDDVDAMRNSGDLEGPFAAIMDKMEAALSSMGWERYGAEGDMFNPEYHEALLVQPSTEHDSGVIIKVLRHGYRTTNRVIRPTQVIVSQ